MCKLANPTLNIYLKNLNAPSQILQICKKLYIQNYAYAFVYHDPFTHEDTWLKIGRSAGGEIGERIYRQAGNVPGWTFPLQGPSGSDIKEIIEDFETNNPLCLGLCNIDHISIKIWDVTNVVNEHLTDHAYPSRVCENELLTEYEEIYGCLPVGNLKDTRNEMMKPYVSKGIWDELFDPQ
jgi:hypothetical protein